MIWSRVVPNVPSAAYLPSAIPLLNSDADDRDKRLYLPRQQRNPSSGYDCAAKARKLFIFRATGHKRRLFLIRCEMKKLKLYH